MRKADIANEIFKQVGISKNEAADIVELVLNLLKSVLHSAISSFAAKVLARGAILAQEKKLGLPRVALSHSAQAKSLRSTSIRSHRETHIATTA